MVTVNQIWQQYDSDGNGVLDKAETRRFITDTLHEMDDLSSFNETDFNSCFKLFDTNDDGVISKEEMLTFIRKATSFY